MSSSVSDWAAVLSLGVLVGGAAVDCVVHFLWCKFRDAVALVTEVRSGAAAEEAAFADYPRIAALYDEPARSDIRS